MDSELQRFQLFTEQIKEINELINSEIHFLSKLEEVLFRIAGFINASSGFLHLEYGNKSFLYSYGLSSSSELQFILRYQQESDVAPLFISLIDSEIHDTLELPIKVHDAELGTLFFVNKETRKGVGDFEPIDHSLIKVTTQQIGIALERLDHILLQKELLELNHSILNSTSSAIVATDAELNILLANEKAEEWFKSTNSERLVNLFDGIPVSSQVRRFIHEVVEKQQAMAAEGLVLSASNPRLLKVFASPIKTRVDEGKDLTGFVFSFDDITEFNRMKDTFTRYVSKDVLEYITSTKGSARLGGTKRSSAIFFSDIRGFTSYSEKNSPEEVVETLNQYFNMMIGCIYEEGGQVDKLVGDEIMAVFYEEKGLPHPSVRAVDAAKIMRERLEMFNQFREEQGLQPLYFGVGINYGDVICGNIGSFDRMDYTVIGDVVNTAARLCSSAGKDEILISESVKQHLQSTAEIQVLKPLSVKGKVEPLQVYSVI
ncbi:hypothetical protein EP331_03170 [bacterium]|nr:MAG: hypothetical protein EP331_03170 [bacterium]